MVAMSIGAVRSKEGEVPFKGPGSHEGVRGFVRILISIDSKCLERRFEVLPGVPCATLQAPTQL